MKDQSDSERAGKEAPQPTPQFRRRAWVDFQRALDPLAAPKKLVMEGRSDRPVSSDGRTGRARTS